MSLSKNFPQIGSTEPGRKLRLTKIFSILSAVKLVVRSLLSPTNLGFVEGLLQFFSKEH